jgi:hypothetical protein
MYAKGRSVVQNYTEAVNWYRKAAEQNHSLAQNELGKMYEKGLGVAQDIDEAVKWLMRWERIFTAMPYKEWRRSWEEWRDWKRRKSAMDAAP